VTSKSRRTFVRWGVLLRGRWVFAEEGYEWFPLFAEKLQVFWIDLGRVSKNFNSGFNDNIAEHCHYCEYEFL
jgi:hypothetical protein